MVLGWFWDADSCTRLCLGTTGPSARAGWSLLMGCGCSLPSSWEKLLLLEVSPPRRQQQHLALVEAHPREAAGAAASQESGALSSSSFMFNALGSRAAPLCLFTTCGVTTSCHHLQAGDTRGGGSRTVLQGPLGLCNVCQSDSRFGAISLWFFGRGQLLSGRGHQRVVSPHSLHQSESPAQQPKHFTFYSLISPL